MKTREQIAIEALPRYDEPAMVRHSSMAPDENGEYLKRADVLATFAPPAQGSIDTPEFQRLLMDWYEEIDPRTRRSEAARSKLIAHIDAHLAGRAARQSAAPGDDRQDIIDALRHDAAGGHAATVFQLDRAADMLESAPAPSEPAARLPGVFTSAEDLFESMGVSDAAPSEPVPQGVPEGWQDYLRDGESPLQRLQREIADSDSMASLLARERARFEFLHSNNKDADGWEWGVAKVRFDNSGKVEFLWGLSDHSDIDALIPTGPTATSGGGAVAELCVDDDGLPDLADFNAWWGECSNSPTPQDVVLQYWAQEAWKAGKASVNLAPPPLPATDAASVLEEAAAICDDLHHNWRWDDAVDSDSGPRSCARAIRALISKETA